MKIFVGNKNSSIVRQCSLMIDEKDGALFNDFNSFAKKCILVLGHKSVKSNNLRLQFCYFFRFCMTNKHYMLSGKVRRVWNPNFARKIVNVLNQDKLSRFFVRLLDIHLFCTKIFLNNKLGRFVSDY